ncbi:MAG: hypothetical protein M2R45_02145 [Verrucomicrobia subdivision 3 bacterium]|nr:hypothetical protein [Limisphaerales bacterium]MCS1413722.1 hypothetical protein [Limisphaerales bacterium]
MNPLNKLNVTVAIDTTLSIIAFAKVAAGVGSVQLPLGRHHSSRSCQSASPSLR